MENTNSYPSEHLDIGADRYRYIDLPAICGDRLEKLPVVLRLMLENVVRNNDGAERDAYVAAIFDWLETGTSEAEIAFRPARVLMHDTTSTPALVDIAAMRDELAEAGADPALLNPTLPVDVSIDHSLAVEAYGRPDAATINMSYEIRRNQERYRFLRWASQSLDGVRINPPGTGIMHTINLEQLATVVCTSRAASGELWVMPDMMIGTDSHTPMINGIGVLGWGVGGLEAQTVMFGMPTMLRVPDVIGVELTGRLPPGVLATDLALTVTHLLRGIGVSGEFVEFFGTGVPTLSAGERAVVANMAPEYGATTGYFPVDERTLDYLRQTGRSERAIELVRTYLQRNGLWLNPQARPRYTKLLHIDLNSIGMHAAGPRRPQDLLAYSDIPASLETLNFHPSSTSQLPRYPVAVAAITSCTNTSDPALLIAAALVARKARAFGLKAPAWVKTSLGPGSPAAAAYLERGGFLEDLTATGFDIVGYGCTTCIGNSGPLPEVIVDEAKAGRIHPVAMLSGNRNFTGRIHPDLDLGFLMSPPLVVAYALAGDALRNLENEPVAHGPDGQPVFLKQLWPSHEEVADALAQSVVPEDFKRCFEAAQRNPLWHQLIVGNTPQFPWEEKSTTLRRPPFASLKYGSQLGDYSATPLMVLGDDVTTDHISPASAIPSDSLVADFLVERGDARNDLNVFASRRGNWEVMLRAAFHSKSLVNLLAPEAAVAHTLHAPSGQLMPIWEAAQRYRDEGESIVLVAGERYGTGSSRDWAAKGQRLLGVRAVLALSFERIHRSNLIGMGVLPLRLPAGSGPEVLKLQGGDRIHIKAQEIQPRTAVEVTILRRNGTQVELLATAAVETQLEVELLRRGGVIPAILRKTLAEAGHSVET
ncbi:aconitate hydratase AcnA [Phytopseudomonas seleniipraecipitans]|uniref:Aconitate hydratase n=1 Tax=Phytopseudomonas seleniipraecipitans TaxID=640205 RepID=A0A1G7GJW7_9GAMM|nr:aconitate hydratase AcnA [Pseudomonas seleniipraecipitans]SDE88299.1 aconitase [Pseudomonas seleniipraecipitans]